MKFIGRRHHGHGYCLSIDCTEPLTRKERRRRKRRERQRARREMRQP